MEEEPYVAHVVPIGKDENVPIASVINDSNNHDIHVQGVSSAKPHTYVSASNFEGCWCTLPMMGLHCWGVEALDDDTIATNPPECFAGFPLAPCWGYLCFSCDAVEYKSVADTNVFDGPDGLTIKFHSANKATSNCCGNRGAPCGHPRAVKLFCMPKICHFFIGCLCCNIVRS